MKRIHQTLKLMPLLEQAHQCELKLEFFSSQFSVLFLEIIACFSGSSESMIMLNSLGCATLDPQRLAPFDMNILRRSSSQSLQIILSNGPAFCSEGLRDLDVSLGILVLIWNWCGAQPRFIFLSLVCFYILVLCMFISLFSEMPLFSVRWYLSSWGDSQGGSVSIFHPHFWFLAQSLLVSIY